MFGEDGLSFTFLNKAERCPKYCLLACLQCLRHPSLLGLERWIQFLPVVFFQDPYSYRTARKLMHVPPVIQTSGCFSGWALGLILGVSYVNSSSHSFAVLIFFYLISYDFRALQFFNCNAVALRLFSIAYTLQHIRFNVYIKTHQMKSQIQVHSISMCLK